MAKRRLRSQPRIPGMKRTPRHTALLPSMEDIINREVRRYGVSPSFVIASVFAYAFKIKEQAPYDKPADNKPKRKKRS